MGQSAEEDAVRGKFARSEFGVLLDEKTVIVERDFEKLGQLFVGVGHDGRSQGQQVRGDFNGQAQDMIGDAHRQPFAVADDPGFVFKIVADEDHAGLTGFFVERLPFTIGADVPVENIDARFRVAGFDGQGAFDGVGAADPRTIGPLGLTGSHALNEDRRVQTVEHGIIGQHLAVQLQAGQHPRIFAVKVFIGLQFAGPGGHDGDTMFDGGIIGAIFQNGFEVTHKTVHAGQLGIQVHLKPLFGLDPGHHFGQMGLDVFSSPGPIEAVGLTTQLIGAFHQMGVIPLAGQAQGSRHAGDTAADNQRGLADGEFGFGQRFFQHDLVDGHAHQIHGFLGGDIGIVFVDPGILVADVDHFEQVFVQAGIHQGFLEEGLVGLGRTGGHHHPVEAFFADDVGHAVLSILGTGVHVVGHVFHKGQGGRIIADCRHIHHPGDIDAAVADKDPHPGTIAGYIGFGNDLGCAGQGVSCRTEQFAGGGCRSTGIHDGLGDILGALEGAADINAVPAGGHRVKGGRLAEISRCEAHTQRFGHGDHLGGGLQAHGKDHHVKNFGLHLSVFGHIADRQVVAARYGVDGMHLGPQETDALGFGPFVVTFEVFSVGAHIHEKDRAIQSIAGVLFGDDGLLDGVHAADRRAVLILAAVLVAGSDTLEPCDFLGVLVVRGPGHVSFGGAGGTQEAFELHGGDHVGILAVAVKIQPGRIIGAETGGQNDRPHLKVQHFPLLPMGFQGDRAGAAGLHALVALAAVAAVQAAVGFGLAGFLGQALFHLVKIAPARFGGQFAHFGACRHRFVGWNRAVDRIVTLDGLASGSYVDAVEIALDGLGCFLAGRNGADGHPGSGLQVAAGKNAFPAGGIGDGVHLGGAPAGELQVLNRVDGRQVRPLADGRNQLVDIQIVLAARDRHGATASRGIRFAQLHADAAQSTHPAVGGQNLLGGGQVGQ